MNYNQIVESVKSLLRLALAATRDRIARRRKIQCGTHFRDGVRD